MDPELSEVAQEFAAVLEKLHVPYLVGGSLASSFHGEHRTSVDVDFAAEVRPKDADALIEALEPTFFVHAADVRDAVRDLRSFNVVHRKRFVKVDVFVQAGAGFPRQQILRAQRISLGGPGSPTVRVASAEDIVLQKLIWYRMTDETSDRQWRDVQGVLKNVGAGIDRAYMELWAREMGLDLLLERAMREAGLSGDGGLPATEAR